MKRWVWYVALILAIIFFRMTWKLMLPFLLAAVLAAMLNPVVTWVTRKTPLGRQVATIVVFVICGLLGGGILILASAALLQGVATFTEHLPMYRDTLTVVTEDLISQIARIFSRIPPDVISVAQENIGELYRGIQRVLTNLGQSLIVALGSLPGWFAMLLISLLAAYFITKDWAWITASLFGLLPEEWQESAQKASKEIGQALGRYILAQTIVIGISTSLSMLGLLIIGVDRWLAAGLVGGLLDVVPVVGPSVLYIPWAIYSWLVGQRRLAVALVLMFSLVSALRQFVTPKVVGDTLGIHPLIMMAGLYWGAILLGAKGIILAPIILIFIKAVLKVREEMRIGQI